MVAPIEVITPSDTCENILACCANGEFDYLIEEDDDYTAEAGEEDLILY